MDPFRIALLVFIGALVLAGGIKLFQEISKQTSQQKFNFLIFTGGSLALGVIVIVSADTFARITISHESISHAISECFHYLIVQPIGTLLLLLPFFVTGAVSAIKSKNRNIRHGYCLLTCGHLPLLLLYFYGYLGSQHALQKHAWTAAALSIGLMPFMSVPLIGIGLLVGTFISNLLDKKNPI